MYRLIFLAILATATAVWAQDTMPDKDSAPETDVGALEGLTDEEVQKHRPELHEILATAKRP